MSAQIKDKFIEKEEEYWIVAREGMIPFLPQDYGIIPQGISSICWNGYWCEYFILNEKLILMNFYINSKNHYYPVINNRKPEEIKKPSREYFRCIKHHLYKNLNLFMDYTGKILVGKGFLNQYGIHMGYQAAWSYEVLKEWVFQNGKRIEVIDHSEKAKRVREEIEKKRNTEKGEKKTETVSQEIITEFIRKSFSLEITEKAWWIE